MGRDGPWQHAEAGKDTGPCLRASILWMDAGIGEGVGYGSRQEKAELAGRCWDPVC